MPVNANIIKKVVDKTIKAIESSKAEIYKIVENARMQVDSIKVELQHTQEKIEKVILEVDELERKDKLMRQKLVQVNKNMNLHSENDMRDAYEQASEIRVAYKMKEQEEHSLRTKRSSLEVNLRQAEEILKSAERIINQVSVAMNFLSGELGQNVDDAEDNEYVLGIKMLTTLEHEKRKLSREIHDGPAQGLANLVMKADICKAVVQKDMQEGLKELDELKDNVRATLRDIRHIIYELRPGMLEEQSLVHSLKRLLAEFKARTDWVMEFKSAQPSKEIDPIIQVAVFRVIQESLNNVRKHANATRVSVIIDFDEECIFVQIVDDGNGFDVENVLSQLKENGDSYGLIGIQERIEQLQGEFVCNSQIGRGTETKFKLPRSKEVMLNVCRTN